MVQYPLQDRFGKRQPIVGARNSWITMTPILQLEDRSMGNSIDVSKIQSEHIKNKLIRAKNIIILN